MKLVNLFHYTIMILILVQGCILSDFVGNYVHETTHIHQIRNHGTANITEVCYYGDDMQGIASGWIESRANLSVWNGASEPQAYANGWTATIIVLALNALVIVCYYINTIDDNKEIKIQPEDLNSLEFLQ